MALCPQLLVALPCNQSGVGYTRLAFNAADNFITLMDGNGANFPAVPVGQHYYVRINSACGTCCAELKVVSKVADVLGVIRMGTALCACIGTNATIRYTEKSRHVVEDVLAELGINVLPPLKYDCATKTLSIDCSTMQQGCAPCSGT